ncbi:SpoIID/LytB domain-containing protein [Duncaniella muris]|uniref:SpoIID/LytB domain-containing protein n=2 Tax=Duncaniella muris TaxID=2094150 RepID=UPI00272E9477|nr:SpoIID/LytB domain-containing protein [Duncaniella muris]
MPQEPRVRVGILSAPTISFTLTGLYSTPSGEMVTGRQEVSLSESGLAVSWNGRVSQSLEFEPTSYAGDSFELEGVTIGVDFHWERKENQRFRGALRVIVENGRLTAVNEVNVEDYLVSVISSEMSSTSSLELLRAHAVISRGWVLSMMSRGKEPIPPADRRPDVRALNPGPSLIRYWDREDHLNFDVCADDHCQRYQGISRVSTPVAAGAVADTRGMVLTFDGELCDTRFSKCCGGVFEVFETCWDDTPRPYLQPRRDGVDPTDFPDLTVEENAVSWILGKPEAFCNTTDRRVLSQVLNGYDRETPDFYRWTETLTQEKITRLVADRLGEDLGRILSLTPLTRGTSGRIRELKITGTKGERIIGKELMIRRTLSDSHLYSSAFVVEPLAPEADGTPSGFTLHGAGWGHGAGLCQIGAAIMGERGYGYSEILARYYPGSTLTRLY